MKQYQKGEFCKAKDCPGVIKNDKGFCKSCCYYTAYDFHDWLNKHGYQIIRKDDAAEKACQGKRTMLRIEERDKE